MGTFDSFEMAKMFGNGFPKEMKKIVADVVNMIPRETYRSVNFYVSPNEITYLLNNDEIKFPYRVYLIEPNDGIALKMNPTEKMILHCIYSRNCNGYVREKHIKELLLTEMPEWTIPYIVKVCDEYVIEILQTVYEHLKGKNIDRIKQLCANNYQFFCLSYNRMISYWNEFYRNDCYRFENYIGRKLFIECFGATRTMNCTK